MTDSPLIRVLLVDDEPLAREMLREMLQGDPQVQIVGESCNGREALEAIRNESPDLIFLDVQMPEVGGFEVLASLRKEKIPYVIFVTAYDQYAVRAFEVQALDYLLKPFDQERFDVSWQRAKAQLLRDRNGGMDQRILALLEELKAGKNYLERLVIKAAGRIYFLETNEIDWIEAEGNYAHVRSVHVHAWGDEGKPTLVCLHGVTAWGGHFALLATALAGSHRVVAPDLLGHGVSPQEPPWRIDDHLDAVERSVSAAPFWLGHWFGGRLAFEHAARHPGEVERLVLLDPAILLAPHVALWAAENARRERVYESFESGIDRRYEESQLHRAPRDLIEAELREHLVEQADGWRYRYAQACVVSAYGEMATTPPAYADVRVPTLLVPRRRLLPAVRPPSRRASRGARRAARGRHRPGGTPSCGTPSTRPPWRSRASSDRRRAPTRRARPLSRGLVEDRDARVDLVSRDRERRHDMSMFQWVIR